MDSGHIANHTTSPYFYFVEKSHLSIQMRYSIYISLVYSCGLASVMKPSLIFIFWTRVRILAIQNCNETQKIHSTYFRNKCQCHWSQNLIISGFSQIQYKQRRQTIKTHAITSIWHLHHLSLNHHKYMLFKIPFRKKGNYFQFLTELHLNKLIIEEPWTVGKHFIPRIRGSANSDKAGFSYSFIWFVYIYSTNKTITFPWQCDISDLSVFYVVNGKVGVYTVTWQKVIKKKLKECLLKYTILSQIAIKKNLQQV